MDLPNGTGESVFAHAACTRNSIPFLSLVNWLRTNLACGIALSVAS